MLLVVDDADGRNSWKHCESSRVRAAVPEGMKGRGRLGPEL